MRLYKIRKTMAVLMILVPMGFTGYLLYEVLRDALRYDSSSNMIMAAAVLIPLLVTGGAACYGLVRNRAWGRWLALAAGVGGFFFMALGNAIFSTSAPTLAVMVCFGLLAATMLGRGMADKYEKHPGSGLPFHQKNRQTALVSWGTIICLASVPAIWLFALLPYPAMNTSAIVPGVVATLIAAGALLIQRQRTGGLVLMLLAGMGALYMVLHNVLNLASAGCCNSHRLLEQIFFAANCSLAVLGAALILVGAGKPLWRQLRTPQ